MANKTFLRNVILTKKDGNTTEIDAILVHNKGIFVIEQKSSVFKTFVGDIDDDEWLWGKYDNLDIFNDSEYHKYKMKNPIKQNYGHIRALENTIGKYKYWNLAITQFKPYITNKKDGVYWNILNNMPAYIRTHKCDNRIIMPVQLYSISNLVEFLNIQGVQDIYTDNDVLKISNKIALYEASDEKRKAHADSISQRFGQN